MSRIGKKPITVPSGVKVTLDPKARTINVEGPKGKLSFSYRPEVGVAWDEGEHRIICSIAQEQMRVGQMRAYWGTTRAQIENMVVGVTRGFMKKLDVVGVGWGAKAMGKVIELNVGHCHPVRVPVPEGVEVGVQDLPRPLNGLGIAIVSTSKGVMSDRRCRRENVAGEIVAIVM